MQFPAPELISSVGLKAAQRASLDIHVRHRCTNERIAV